jgi:hypothetical protein
VKEKCSSPFFTHRELEKYQIRTSTEFLTPSIRIKSVVKEDCSTTQFTHKELKKYQIKTSYSSEFLTLNIHFELPKDCRGNGLVQFCNGSFQFPQGVHKFLMGFHLFFLVDKRLNIWVNAPIFDKRLSKGSSINKGKNPTPIKVVCMSGIEHIVTLC